MFAVSDDLAAQVFQRFQIISACVNMLAIIAAPIVLLRSRKQAEKDGRTFDIDSDLAAFVDLIARFSEAQRADNEKLVVLAQDVAAIRTAMAAFADPRNNIDRAIIGLAREALEKYGAREPDVGWDRYFGEKLR